MTDILTILYYHWDYFLLLLLRVSGLLFISPIFGRRAIPVIARIGYCAFIAILFYISIPGVKEVDYSSNVWLYILLCVKELLFGMVFGAVVSFFFSFTNTAGQLIDMQIGFAMVNVLDPGTGMNSPIMSLFLNTAMLLCFFAVDGHLYLIDFLHMSLQTVPVGSVQFNPNLAWIMLGFFVQAFIMGIMVALPIISSGLLSDISFGLLMKTVPQLNAFAIGIPVKMILGFMVLTVFMPVYIPFCQYMFQQLFNGMAEVYTYLGGQVVTGNGG